MLTRYALCLLLTAPGCHLIFPFDPGDRADSGIPDGQLKPDGPGSSAKGEVVPLQGMGIEKLYLRVGS